MPAGEINSIVRGSWPCLASNTQYLSFTFSGDCSLIDCVGLGQGVDPAVTNHIWGNFSGGRKKSAFHYEQTSVVRYLFRSANWYCGTHCYSRRSLQLVARALRGSLRQHGTNNLGYLCRNEQLAQTLHKPKDPPPNINQGANARNTSTRLVVQSTVELMPYGHRALSCQHPGSCSICSILGLSQYVAESNPQAVQQQRELSVEPCEDVLVSNNAC